MKKLINLHGRQVEAEHNAIHTLIVKLDDNVTVTGYGPTEDTAYVDLVNKVQRNEVVAMDTPKGRVIAASVTQKL